MRVSVLFCLGVALAGCSDDDQGEPQQEPAAVDRVENESAPTPTPQPDDAAVDDAAPPLEGADFIDEARMLHRVVACGEGALPDHIDPDLVEKHCARIEPQMEQYRDRYGRRMTDFLQRLQPESVPDTVVYPFGGGDLISTLVAYPDATEITTLSLEQAGDPRRIRDLEGAKLRDDLEEMREEFGGLLKVGSNTSQNLMDQHDNELPGQLSSFLVALVVHGFEPVHVRYFRLNDDGSLHYYTEGEIAELDAEEAKRLKYDWVDPNFSPAFKHVEIQFREVDADRGAPLRVHRHFGANLNDPSLEKNPALMKYLEARGEQVATLVKGASYLLWRFDFETIREYLIEVSAYMISDSTGIPPRFLRGTDMVQYTFGRFDESFLEASEKHNEDFRELWRRQPRRGLPARFGYVDEKKRAHLVLTVPKGTEIPAFTDDGD